jgi:very-short-patch-repair endonuclease
MRREMTPAERELWRELRGNRLNGLHFRRQQPIGKYIVDFYCERARLAVELDSQAHDMRARLDRQRDRELAMAGVKVLRIPNEKVFQDVELVARWIADEARKRIRPST